MTGHLKDEEQDMRVLVIGASGVIGRRLVPQLRERGHEVTGTSRSAAKAEQLRALGAQPAVLDALDADAVRQVVAGARPDAIVYESTAIAGVSDFKHLDRSFAPTNRLRTEGTDHVMAAARDAGVRRVVAQSYAPNRYIREGGMVKTEDDPLDPNPPAAMSQTVAAMNHLERAVTDGGGIALRYGGFYGEADDAMVDAIRSRKFPVVGNGAGVISFIHLDDAAAATVLALDHDGPAIYNIVDDDPAPAAVWLPEIAKIIGGRRPMHIPRLAAKLVAGDMAVMMATESRGSSNAKAKRELGWTLRYPSWREGFVVAYGQPARTAA
jgi:2-alkyl-3-oxoalkanoate reductase